MPSALIRIRRQSPSFQQLLQPPKVGFRDDSIVKKACRCSGLFGSFHRKLSTFGSHLHRLCQQQLVAPSAPLQVLTKQCYETRHKNTHGCRGQNSEPGIHGVAAPDASLDTWAHLASEVVKLPFDAKEDLINALQLTRDISTDDETGDADGREDRPEGTPVELPHSGTDYTLPMMSRNNAKHASFQSYGSCPLHRQLFLHPSRGFQLRLSREIHH